MNLLATFHLKEFNKHGSQQHNKTNIIGTVASSNKSLLHFASPILQLCHNQHQAVYRSDTHSYALDSNKKGAISSLLKSTTLGELH